MPGLRRTRIAPRILWGKTTVTRGRPFHILGHRGALTLAPENTLSAFEICTLAGTGIEMDLRRTRDGVLVMMHDKTVDRTTDGKGAVAEMTFAELRKLDAGSWFRSYFAGEKIPTFEETLKVVETRRRKPLMLAIDVKVPFDKPQAAQLAEMLASRDMHEQCFLLGTDDETARTFHAVRPRLKLAATCLADEDVNAALESDLYDVLWCGSGREYRRDAARAHAKGKLIFAATVNHADDVLRLFEEDVDGLVTNHPLAMARLLEPPPAERDWDHYLAPADREYYRYHPPGATKKIRRQGDKNL